MLDPAFGRTQTRAGAGDFDGQDSAYPLQYHAPYAPTYAPPPGPPPSGPGAKVLDADEETLRDGYAGYEAPTLAYGGMKGTPTPTPKEDPFADFDESVNPAKTQGRPNESRDTLV